MKRLTLIFSALVIVLLSQKAQAQTSTNNVHIISSDENPGGFINGISFTPEGILRTTESGGTKSIKVVNAPVVSPTEVVAEEATIEKLAPIQFKYAMMMNVDVETLKNLTLLGFIEDWFGTRYRYGGETKKGIDCSALTSALLMAVYGFAVPRTAQQQYDACEPVKREDLKEGDLVFFNTTGGVSHVGLYLYNNYFVQSSSSQGVTISNLDETYFAKRYIGAGRIIKQDALAKN